MTDDEVRAEFARIVAEEKLGDLPIVGTVEYGDWLRSQDCTCDVRWHAHQLFKRRMGEL